MSNYRSRDEEPSLFEVAGNAYYFDLNELSQFIRIEKESVEDSILENDVDKVLGDPSSKTDGDSTSDNEETPYDMYHQIIDVTKWETTKVMIETVLTEQGPIDEAMGIEKLGKDLSIPFKLSFNTLLKYKIIKDNNGR